MNNSILESGHSDPNQNTNSRQKKVRQKLAPKLPQIALIADQKNWAFHNYCIQISKHLSGIYNFKVFFLSDYPEIEVLLSEVKDYDLVHFFWRDSLYSVLMEYSRYSVTQKGWNYFDFITQVVAKTNISISIYDHLLLTPQEIKEREILFTGLSVNYATVSKRLEKIYSDIQIYPKPFGAVEDGVDLEFFKPENLARLTDLNREIVIGWVGNSKWGNSDGIDHKGLETIIKPTVENLKKEGYKVCGFYADREERWIPHSEMNDYYNSIDIYICASDIEGTPNPILEAMACGIPVITTDVGMVPQLFGDLQKQFILESRSIENLQMKLIELIETPSKREALSKENLKRIQNWSWANQCQRWHEFFESSLKQIRDIQFKEMRNLIRTLRLELYLNAKSSLTEIEELRKVLSFTESRVYELENYTVDLQTAVKDKENRIAELENWSVELQKVINSSKKQIEADHQEKEELQNFIKEKQTEIYNLSLTQNQLLNELELSRNTIAMMEDSKFWKLRNNWVKLKTTVSGNSDNK